MASISTSSSPSANFFLRLRERDKAGSADPNGHSFPLFEQSTWSDAIDLERSGTVKESASYVVDLLSFEPLTDSYLWFGVGNEEPARIYASATSSPVEVKGRNYHWYSLAIEGDGKLFRMSFGFVRLEVLVRDPISQTMRALRSKDIPCASTYEDQQKVVSAIFDDLASPHADTAMSWMLDVPHDAESSAAPLEGVLNTTSKSLRSYVSLVERILAGYRASFPYIRGHAHSKTVKSETMIDAGKVQRLGHHELVWMARNSEDFYETAPGAGIAVGRNTFSMREIQAQSIKKDFDNRENRAVIAFLDAVCQSLVEVGRKAADAVSGMSDMLAQLEAMDESDELVLAKSVAKVCAEREIPLVQKTQSMRKEALRILRLYRQALPGVKGVRYKGQARTKVFQEIPAYAALFDLMGKWDRFGRFTLERDGLLLRTYRIDRLYEYYVLYKILDWLDSAGFAPCESTDMPIGQVVYSLDDPKFSNQDQVANHYTMARGTEKVTLLYEPVCYADAREEGSNVLHRTSSIHTGSAISGFGFDSYWLPDFVLIHEPEGGRRSVALFDAKFTTVSRAGVHNKPGVSSDFWRCFAKYKGSMLANDGRQVDHLWLLCGRMFEQQVEVLQDSTWARESAQISKDGAASLAPHANCLNEVFENVGIRKVAGTDGGTDDEALPLRSSVQPRAAESEHALGPEPPVAKQASTEGRLEKRVPPKAAAEASVQAETGAPETARETATWTDATREEAAPSSTLPIGAMDIRGENLDEQGEHFSPGTDSEPAGTEEKQSGAAAGQEGPGAGSSNPETGLDKSAVKPKLSDVKEAAIEPPGQPPPLSQPSSKKKERKARGARRAAPITSTLDEELLSVLVDLYKTSPNKAMLLDAGFAQRVLGLDHPVFRAARPTGNERKRYTPNPIAVGNESFYVYLQWLPPQVSRLKSYAKKAAEKKGAEEEVGSKNKPEDAGSSTRDERISSLVREAIDALGQSEPFTSTDFCHRQFGLNTAALRAKRPAANGTRGRHVEFEADGRTFYLTTKWSKFNLMKLETFVKSKRRARD